jgi:DNA/RNA endonuclease G (NUC1)
VSWHLTDEWNGTLARVDTFRADPAVPPAWYRVLGTDFSFSGFDRGHMTPNADRDKETSIPINQATYLMSNMVAQAPDNNQGPWADLENYLRTFEPANELYIISGPLGTGGSGSNGGTTTTLANGHVTVPAYTWKVALILPKATGDDVARVTPATHTIAVVMPNVQGIRNNDWHIYLTTVEHVEQLTGYDFFSNVPPAIQAAIEGGVDGVNPPGTADQSTSTNEDVQASISLDAVTPAGALTYSVLTGPFHGTLTGSGANRTYTPAPDYNGTDTFTWRVNDGTNDSNTSTMTITVLEVNDPPTAVDDSKVTTGNLPVTFPGSDLTANDSPGPANESGQTLTVTSVTPTANTHGNVVLNAGQITYTPASGYVGPASFTYTVCDNGVTVGLADPQCTTATVNVTVNPQLTTHFSVSAPANVANGVPFNVTVTALDASNTTIPSYTGTVHFASSSAGTLPADYTFVAGDAGTHTFSVTLTTAGAQSVTATDTVTSSITGTADTAVAAAPVVTHFSVSTPGSVTISNGYTFNVTVTALDASNAVVPGYRGTVDVFSDAALVSINVYPVPHTYTAADNGVFTFAVGIYNPGHWNIIATDAANSSIAGSGPVTVNLPPATHLYLTTLSGSVVAGTPFTLTVTPLDANNSPTSNYTGTFHFTSSGSATLPADYTYLGIPDGSGHSFSITLASLGGQTITATDTTSGSITGTTSLFVSCPTLSVTASNNGPACTSASVQLNANTATIGATFAWTGPGGFTSTQQSPTVTTGGTYSVTMTGVAGCTATSSTIVVFGNLPAFAITAPASVCANHLTTASVPSAGAGATYNWTISDGTITIGAGTDTVTFSGAATGSTVMLNVSISTPGGCSGSASKTINVIPNPTVTLPATMAVCGPQTVTIPITLTGTAPWTILWSDGTEQDNVTTSTLTRTFNATTSTTLGITVLYDASCNTASPANYIQISVDSAPAITTQPQDAFVAPGSPATFTVSATGSNLHYQWFQQEGEGVVKSVGTDTSSYTINPVHGNSTVWVVIHNACGTVESIHVQGGVETSRRRAAGH